MPKNPIAAFLSDEEKSESGMVRRLRAAGRQIIEDPGVQAGVAQVVASLASLAVRAFGPKCMALARRRPDHE